MLLKVTYQDDKYDMVRPSLLNELIASKKIKKFYRSLLWTDIERDPIRRAAGSYVGLDRRKQSSLSSRLTIMSKAQNNLYFDYMLYSANIALLSKAVPPTRKVKLLLTSHQKLYHFGLGYSYHINRGKSLD
jgi:hypothetical protein